MKQIKYDMSKAWGVIISVINKLTRKGQNTMF